MHIPHFFNARLINVPVIVFAPTVCKFQGLVKPSQTCCAIPPAIALRVKK